MYPDQCSAVYDRVLPGETQPTYVRCTYIVDHPARHSFETLKVTDEAETAARAAARRAGGNVVDLPPAVAALVAQITEGDYDPFLEAVLTAAHGRKLTRRGVAGFRREVAGRFS